jgi:hypothetical protein
MAAVTSLVRGVLTDTQIFLSYLLVYLFLSSGVVSVVFGFPGKFAGQRMELLGEFAPRLVARQVDDCTSECSWITQAESCGDNDACDCQILTTQGASGVAACANCLFPMNSTLAFEVVEVGQDCGVQAAGLVTFALPPTSSTTTATASPSTSTKHLTRTTTSPSLTSVLPAFPFTSSTTSPTSFSSTPTASSISSEVPVNGTSQTTSPTQSSSSSSSGLSGGAIGGIVGGIVGLFIILAALMFLLVRRYKRPPPPAPVSTEESTPKFLDEPPPVAAGDNNVPSGRLRYPLDFQEGNSDAAGGRLSRVY